MSAPRATPRGVGTPDAMPIVHRLEDFDQDSGSWLERLVFKHRPAFVAASLAATVTLGAVAATRLVLDADFELRIPRRHPFTQAYLDNASHLRGLGNSLQVVVENTAGDVYDAAYLEALRGITDELVLTPGVDRPGVRSLWMPGVRWSEVTEEGFRGGPVMPDDYDGSPGAIERLRHNVARAGLSGALVAHDGRSSAVFVPLLPRDPVTGRGIDHAALGRSLEAIRSRYEDSPASSLRVRVVGFAKLMADLLAGMRQIVTYFAVAVGLVSAILLAHVRCLRSTILIVGCSLAAVSWQLGLVALLGVRLDPYSVLVPFLVFAMGVSHGAQKMNGIMQDVARGTHRLVAARYTFRRLFLAGLTAVLTDVVSFAVLLLVDVPAIRLLGLTAMVGSAVLVVTNLLLLPVLLSYVGVSPAAAARSLRAEEGDGAAPAAWRLLERLARPRWAAGALAAGAVVAGAAWLVARHLQVGDLDPGAPELSPRSRYNADAAFVTGHFGQSSDVFAVIVKTPPEGCVEYRTLVEADRLGWELQQVSGVLATASIADPVRRVTAGSFEGSPKWLTLSRNQQVLDYAAQQAIARSPELVDADCSVMPVIAYLSDHRAATLDEVVRVAGAFAARHAEPGRRFLLAAGSAGIEAATNLVVRRARWPMTLCAYAAVALLCLAAFRSWRAVVVAVLPLAVTQLLCEAAMVWLGIGMKIATLPVIAFGVGIPDFALYLLSVQLAHQRAGVPLAEAYGRALRFTGKVIVFVSLTLAAAVCTWRWSPIRLQSDMGVLLALMFLGNMATALLLVPALSRALLHLPAGGAVRGGEPGAAPAWTTAGRPP